MEYDFRKTIEDQLAAANAQILRQGQVIDALLEALGPAADDIYEMVLEDLDSSD